MLVNGLLNRFLRNISDDLFLHFSTLEHQQGGDAAHAITHGRSAVVVNIHFADLEFALVVLGQLLNDRSDCLARPAPNSPEVDQDWSLRFENILNEIPVFYFKDSLAFHDSLHWRTFFGVAQRNSKKAHPSIIIMDF